MRVAYQYGNDDLLNNTILLSSTAPIPDNSTLISPFSFCLKTIPKWNNDHWEESGVTVAAKDFPTTSTTEQLSQLAIQVADFEKKHEQIEADLKAQIAQLSSKPSSASEGVKN